MNQELFEKIEVALARVGLREWQPGTEVGYEVAASGDDVLVMPLVNNSVVGKQQNPQREKETYDLIKQALDSASLCYDQEKGEPDSMWVVVKCPGN